MIRWVAEDGLEVHLLKYPGDKNPKRIVFGQGDDTSSSACRMFMENFIATGNNGYSYSRDYTRYAEISDKLWEAGIRVYGKPNLILPPSALPPSNLLSNTTSGIQPATTGPFGTGPGHRR